MFVNWITQLDRLHPIGSPLPNVKYVGLLLFQAIGIPTFELYIPREPSHLPCDMEAWKLIFLPKKHHLLRGGWTVHSCQEGIHRCILWKSTASMFSIFIIFWNHLTKFFINDYIIRYRNISLYYYIAYPIKFQTSVYIYILRHIYR